MALYEGGLLKVVRKLDGKGRLQLPGDFREACRVCLRRRSGNNRGYAERRQKTSAYDNKKGR